MTGEARDETIRLNGLRFHYREWGPEAAPSLVLLHGLTAHARSWDPVARAMADRFRVLALDQRGHGETEWARDYAPERWLEDVDAFVRALDLRRPALCGHSMGAWIAFACVAAFPVDPSRLVIIDIGPDGEGGRRGRVTGRLRREFFDDPEAAFRHRRKGVPQTSHRELRRWVLDNVVRCADGRWTWRWDPALGRTAIRAEAAAEWAALARITCPTLLIRGARSDLLSRATAERMARVIPCCRLVEVPESGHTVPGDNPAGLAAVLREFLLA